MEKAQGWEVTEYGQEHNIPGRAQGYIKEIVQEMGRLSPSVGLQVTFTGNMMKLTYHSYEMHLPVRIREVEERAKQALNEAVKELKKQYKVRSGEGLDITEKKDMANTSVQKVSLNERYMYASWRFYEFAE